MARFFRTIVTPVLCILLVTISFGCKKDDDDDDDDDDDSTVISTGTPVSDSYNGDFLLDATENTAPVIAPGSLTLAVADLGSVYSGIFNMLRSWNPATDNGVVDMGNIYHVLDVAGDTYEAMASKCTKFDAEKIVGAPFDFGLEELYACGATSGAMGDEYAKSVAVNESEDSKTKMMLTGFVWAGDGEQGEFNVIQGKYNETTQDLILDFAQLVDHGQSQFARRIHIEGNVSTHSFEIQSLQGPKDVTSGNWTSMTGKGVSQGDDNYFLLRIKSDNSGWETPKYVCFPADTTGDDLSALATSKPTGDATVDTNCEDYQTTVDAMEFYEAETDLPHALSDFTGKDGSSVLLDY